MAFDAFIHEGGYPEVVLESSRAMKDNKTRNRELDGIREAASLTHCPNLTIVTRDQEEDVEDPRGTIHIVPAWKWFLRQ